MHYKDEGSDIDRLTDATAASLVVLALRQTNNACMEQRQVDNSVPGKIISGLGVA